MESKSRSSAFFRVALAALIALLAIAMLLITLPTLGQSDDYGVESGASGSSLQNKYATQTAVASYLTAIQEQTVSPTPTPVTPTATPTPTPDSQHTEPTARRRG